ncbi:hypothetical protein N9B17_00200 [Rhodopirellula sp.]|nr:hypothetical protein [Rhodopirellula sp.]
MTGVQHLTFIATPFSITLGIVAVLATCGVGYYAWLRSGRMKAVAKLEVLRVLIVALIALLLNQPEWIEQYQPDTKPTIAVLWDDSRSMETRDVLVEGVGGKQAITRAEAVKPLLDSKAWSELDNRLNVVLQPISSAVRSAEEMAGDRNAEPTVVDAEAKTTVTNLKDPLLETASRVGQLMGIVLISDGDWNDGQPPVEAASRLRTKQIPVFTVAAGSANRLPDVELLSVDIPTFGAAGKPVRIPFTIDSSLPRDFVTTVTMEVSNGDILTKDVRVTAMGRTYEAFNWKTTDTGDFTIRVAVPRQAEETIADNNEQAAPIVIREEQLKVLVVESYPRWEYRYLRNALSRDPGVEVSCLLFHPGLEKVGGGSQDYIQLFPEAIEDLATYDVVFLGDVGLDDDQLTEEQCELLKGLIEQQASGLVFMPGLQGRQFSLKGTALEELNPVVMDESQPGGWGSRTAGHFELTERGRNSLLTKLADNADENVQVWEDLPGFQWYAPVVRAKAGSEVLAVHNDMSNQYGRLPLLVTRTFGEGKVLFMGTDGAWRWRKGVEDKYHYRFWGQVVRWMAYQRNMVKGKGMRLFYKPDQPQVRKTLTFSAHVMDKGGEPLQQGDVLVTVTSPAGTVDTVRLTAEGDQWGVFQGRFTPQEPGKHAVAVLCQQTGVKLDATLYVRGQAVEQVGKPARPDVLEEIALVSRGKAVAQTDVAEIIKLLSTLPQPEPSLRRLQLWSHPLMFLGLVVLLGIFWVWRKAVGLI